MGGNALKTVATRRVEAAEYRELTAALVKALTPHFKQVAPVPAYHQKPDFGDIDILVDIDNEPGDIRKLLLDTLKPQEMVHNGDCYSFDYKDVQIDVITTHTRIMPVHLAYYSYNDMGNLMGKLSNNFGLKYGHRGLYSAVRKNNGTTHLGEVELSVDPEEILTFLGYDYHRYQQGFETKEDIFKFITSTRYFNKSIFEEDHMNHADRTRNRKRPVFQEFLAWIETQAKGLPTYHFEDNPMRYIPMLDKAFPAANLIATRQKMFDEFDRKQSLQAKLREAIAPLKLEGKELGAAMIAFKSKHKDYFTFVEQSTPEEILADFGPTNGPDLN